MLVLLVRQTLMVSRALQTVLTINDDQRNDYKGKSFLMSEGFCSVDREPDIILFIIPFGNEFTNFLSILLAFFYSEISRYGFINKL